MIKNTFKEAILLYILWIVLSGRTEVKFLVFGGISALVAAVLCTPAMYIENKQTGKSYFLLETSPWRFFTYALWLFFEIIKAALHVTAAIIRPVPQIHPQVIEFTCHFENPIATATLINSIILTPGTVTLDVSDDNVFLVHALTDSAASGLIEGTMQRKIAHVFKEDDDEIAF